MNAAGFNSYMGSGNLAAGLHFVRGYDVFYDNPDGDIIEVTLFQFATQNDATDFASGWVPGGPANSKADPVIPGATDFDSTTVDQGSADQPTWPPGWPRTRRPAASSSSPASLQGLQG
jgi:hypothetical protein